MPLAGASYKLDERNQRRAERLTRAASVLPAERPSSAGASSNAFWDAKDRPRPGGRRLTCFKGCSDGSPDWGESGRFGCDSLLIVRNGAL